MKINGLVVALDTFNDSTENLAAFMQRYKYNALRIYEGWGWSYYTGNLADPFNAQTKTTITNLLVMCKTNGWPAVFSVGCQCQPFYNDYPASRQLGFNGEPGWGSNYPDPRHPEFKTFTINKIKTVVSLMQQAEVEPWISLDEVQYTPAGDNVSFYSETTKNAYSNAPHVPLNGPYTQEQKDFIHFCKTALEDFYSEAQAAAACRFGALVDPYWIEGQAIDLSQPWNTYGSMENLASQWYDAVRLGQWEYVNECQTRIKNLHSGSNFFMYGLSNGTSPENIRESVRLAMANGYDGVFMYEYLTAKSNPVDVSDLVIEPTPPEPPATIQQWTVTKTEPKPVQEWKITVYPEHGVSGWM